jgi:hypothetical protein
VTNSIVANLGQLSDDGHWLWDGSEWRPTACERRRTRPGRLVVGLWIIAVSGALLRVRATSPPASSTAP